jgi:hypothetical protein
MSIFRGRDRFLETEAEQVRELFMSKASRGTPLSVGVRIVVSKRRAGLSRSWLGGCEAWLSLLY